MPSQKIDNVIILLREMINIILFSKNDYTQLGISVPCSRPLVELKFEKTFKPYFFHDFKIMSNKVIKSYCIIF